MLFPWPGNERESNEQAGWCRQCERSTRFRWGRFGWRCEKCNASGLTGVRGPRS